LTGIGFIGAGLILRDEGQGLARARERASAQGQGQDEVEVTGVTGSTPPSVVSGLAVSRSGESAT
jgi:hypothetical protein